ncbi:toprim domain-containing protein [Bacteroides acidifaciens]|uniref:toprim domain-containing protein n=1 Tax=Bacteroides acidifaciens TaxID=85831 RepID=UPI0025AEAAAD|nr:toprim domain-containing protein [Bacteroides acidifaciens]
MLKEIKSIPLATFMSQLGYFPVKTQGYRLWYKSPLRQEHTASFKVQADINCWYDFGIGKGGNIINLAAELYQSNDLRYLMDCIARCVSVSPPQTVASSSPQRHSAPSFTDIEVVPLRHHALVAYLQERGIPAQIAVKHCKQIHFSCRGKRYYAVGFANENGGYETRNRYFKGCIAPKDITLRRIRDGPTNDVAVFEGFIDYLSALKLGIIQGMDAIILNSVSNVGKAIPYLRDYNTINCYLDNDNAGKSAFATISDEFGNVIDRSFLYTWFNDLNEYLTQSKNAINPISQQTKISKL